MTTVDEITQAFDYKVFYDEAPVGYFTFNHSGIILKANKHFLNLVQRYAEEVIGKMCFWDFLPVGDKIFYQTHYFPTLQMEGKIKEISFDLLTKHEARIPILVNTIKSEESNETSVYNSVVFNISQRKLYERELIEERKRAEKLTSELRYTNDQMLAQAETINTQNKSLDRLNAIKDKFFGIIAHDIKDPLHQLNGFITLITDQIDQLSKNDIKEMGLGVKKSLSDTIDLTNNLFAWAQSQIKEYGVKNSIFLIERIIKEVINSNLPAARKKNIDLNYTMDGNPQVMADENQLQFIIRNLIINALKFTSPGGVIKVHSTLTEDKLVKISVTDNGVGMSEAFRETLFNNYVKTSEMGTGGEKGHGIGLTLVKEFVAMNHGTIEVQSKQGEGTTFVVSLNAG